MFKKGLDVLNKTKEAAKASIVELVEEPENVVTAKNQIKNMKWNLKLLIELSRNYYMASDKQVQQGNGLAQILQRFGEKTSHTNYISNQTVPLSVSLLEVGGAIKDSQLLFQQYNQQFYDRLANQLTALYEGSVKKVIAFEKQQEDVRAKYSATVYNLKNAQKSGQKLQERQAEHDQSKALYDQSTMNLEQMTVEMVTTTQREVAAALKQFVQDQKRFIEEGIRMWTEAEGKIFGVESPAAVTPQQHHSFEQQPAVSLEKLNLHEHQDPQPFEATSPQDHYQNTSSPPPETYVAPNNDANPFDDHNPFESVQ
ncbi:hypothetical protein PPL_02990 [Heterostelium album PN500]|uniref:Uncharacterized protein n=1 Tax=Heterostelium pallidum (strain ATCC 26659 / Pp 5 / PN500) TaxID=670386 RepID=D3B3M2_HETP5|nr:hypothetical protein PPL_02990 [Heterostelium album PN500]EFA83920.1 hypothetical protein PPL_02990 [Heterostelium album PN500]|eukprot:XP_020436037.1 hypothetical protein PPL_02990 [Heterostelium album PN500]